MLDGLHHKKDTKIALDVLTQLNVLKIIFIVIVKIEHHLGVFFNSFFCCNPNTIIWSFMFIPKGV